MYFKTFDKLDIETKIEILYETKCLYDLTTTKGQQALKRDFKLLEPQIKKIMIKKGLYKEA